MWLGVCTLFYLSKACALSAALQDTTSIFQEQCNSAQLHELKRVAQANGIWRSTIDDHWSLVTSQLQMIHLVRLQQPPMAHFLEHLKGTTPLPEPEHWILSIHRLGEEEKEKTNGKTSFSTEEWATWGALGLMPSFLASTGGRRETNGIKTKSCSLRSLVAELSSVRVTAKMRLSIPKELFCMLPLAPLKLWVNHWGARGKSIACEVVMRCEAVERIIPPFSHALVAAFKATVPGLRSNQNHEYISLTRFWHYHRGLGRSFILWASANRSTARCHCWPWTNQNINLPKSVSCIN